jgi:transcriptional regulator with XRE-family HTH domain
VIGRKGYAGSAAEPGRSPVGDRLRDAREARGLDIYRVERDTKIRVKYLSALEDGEFTELPGDVYTRGFLRNYASYLGLDADELENEWRGEAGSRPARQALVVGPQPIAVPGRGFVLQRGHFALLGVIVVVALVATYFGYQMTRFLSYPTLGVTDPSTLNIVVDPDTTGYTLTGTATAGTTVEIDQDANALKTVVADDAGHWTLLVTLHAGSNQFNITARNLDTNHASKTTQIIIRVPEVTPTPAVPVVKITTPASRTVVGGGKVTVTGTSQMVSNVTLTAVWLAPPPAAGSTVQPPILASSSPSNSGSPSVSASPVVTGPPIPTATLASPGASVAPGASPASAHPNADGTWTITMTLGPGTWQLNAVGTGTSGRLTDVSAVSVSVPFTGVNVTIKVKGQATWLWYSKDGKAVGTGTFTDGWQVTLVANKYVCLYTSKTNNVYVTINGVDSGTVSRFGGRHLYVDSAGARDISACPAV